MPNRMIIFRMAMASLLFLSAGCARLGQVRLIDENTTVAERNVVVFFVDGVSRSVYRDMLANGELPGIDRYLVRRGLSVERAVTAVPSITYAITTTFATGLVPGHHGVLGNKFFDRDRLLYVDYNTTKTYRDVDDDYIAPTIYEMLDEAFSVTIQTPVRRGVYRKIDNWASSGIRWFFGQITEIDCLTAERFELIGSIARKAGRWPQVIFAYMPATDEMGHRFGPSSEKYRQGMKNADEQVARICSALQHNGLLEKTYLVLVSDHGFVGCGKDRYLDLARLLEEECSLRLVTEGPGRRTHYSDRAAYFNRYEAVVVTGGDRRANIYMSGDDGWSQLATDERLAPIVRLLARQEAVGLVGWRHRDGVAVENHLGRALIVRKPAVRASALADRHYSYRVIDGQDPLGYTGSLRDSGLLDGAFHGADAWLAATAVTEHPDLPCQLAEVFDSRRTGDLLVFAADGWAFAPGSLGGHGGVTADDMLVPMVIAGPGIMPGRSIAVARTVDVAPTIVEMLGGDVEERYRFDGTSLLDEW